MRFDRDMSSTMLQGETWCSVKVLDNLAQYRLNVQLIYVLELACIGVKALLATLHC